MTTVETVETEQGKPIPTSKVELPSEPTASDHRQADPSEPSDQPGTMVWCDGVVSCYASTVPPHCSDYHILSQWWCLLVSAGGLGISSALSQTLARALSVAHCTTPKLVIDHHRDWLGTGQWAHMYSERHTSYTYHLILSSLSKH